MLPSMEDRALSWDHWFLGRQCHDVLQFLRDGHPKVYGKLQSDYPDLVNWCRIPETPSPLGQDFTSQGDPEDIQDAIEETRLVSWITDQPWYIHGVTDEEYESLIQDIDTGKL